MASSSHFGLEAVPRDVDAVLSTLNVQSTSTAFTISDLAPPDSPLAKTIHSYAKEQLNAETYRHSMRVYYIGMAVLRAHFSHTWGKSLASDNTPWFLATLLHDIGTTDANIGSTHLSFEYYGGILARDLILKTAAENSVDAAYAQGVAESVCETIIRHQDVGKRGFVSALTMLIHIGTLFDNAGQNQALVSNATFKAIYDAYPRGPWSSCFAAVIHKECGLKPYASTTRLGEEAFSTAVLANPLNRLEH
ncbi:putative urea hydro-lyase/cyanamide hydratase [Exidia glandulosa HHB12029]|uniref:Putative urea hydro-lyase/cyanamide hydratase n=1 Tax=Exidia glandulosa HHB12029 TaxID=1314781 RepID=A0A165QQN9_EXIGL|nr:putative urea hydro-lyase/cyanamide hydratase [Exidia glandulosa HHB12029]